MRYVNRYLNVFKDNSQPTFLRNKVRTPFQNIRQDLVVKIWTCPEVRTHCCESRVQAFVSMA